MATQEAKEILLVKLGNRIKTIRKSRNLSQKAMAEKCGMDFASYSNIENGKRNVTVFTLQRIIRVLKLSFNELFNF
ncbi:helix-turn-helix domain-containing protein [Flavobacteriaceae bacterium]|jgi:transcriptional regulator with XRE-family HTH domain|nr:helix-turn-helix domain-containing protein [Flavobacteriaceae bacterium]